MQKLLYSLLDFSGGINDKDDPALIPDNTLADSTNVVLARGRAPKRGGFVKYNASALANPVKRLYTFYKNNGTNEFLAVSNATLYKDTAGVLSPVQFNTITALTSSDVQGLTYKDRTINDVALLADKGKLKVYNGTDVREVAPHVPTTGAGGEDTTVGLNDMANLTNFRALAIKQDRLFALAHPTVKNRLSFCHHDPVLGYAVYDYWPAAYFYDMVSEQNDESITLRTFRESIIVFNRRSMWALSGDGTKITDYVLKRINVPSGLMAPESVCFVGNNIFYLSDDHVYSLFSTDMNYISAQIVSQNVENTLKGISQADKAKAVGVFHDNKYYLSFPSGVTLVYDTLLQAWTKYTNIKANSFLVRDGVLYFSAANGYVYRFDETVFSDDGAAIPYMLKTKRLDYGYPVQDKKFRKLWIVAKQYDAETSTFNLSAIVDYVTVNLTDILTDESLVWDEGNWDQASWDFKDVVQKMVRLHEKGRTVQYVITNEVAGEALTIYQIIAQFKLKRPK